MVICLSFGFTDNGQSKVINKKKIKGKRKSIIDAQDYLADYTQGLVTKFDFSFNF